MAALRLCVTVPLTTDQFATRSPIGSPHGGKVFHLYASDAAAYSATTRKGTAPPEGLTLVKRTLLPDQAMAPGPLFLMRFTRAEAAGGPARWEYATASADGSEVYQHGQIASCVACHAEAPFHGLFGLGENLIPSEFPFDAGTVPMQRGE